MSSWSLCPASAPGSLLPCGTALSVRQQPAGRDMVPLRRWGSILGLEGVKMSQFRGVVGAQAGKERPPGILGTWRAMLLAHCPLLEGSSLSPGSQHPSAWWLELWRSCRTGDGEGDVMGDAAAERFLASRSGSVGLEHRAATRRVSAVAGMVWSGGTEPYSSCNWKQAVSRAGAAGDRRPAWRRRSRRPGSSAR